MAGLRGMRVIDLGHGIASSYATKLMADAGADVILLEPPEGDPMRRWSATATDLGDEDGALFRFLSFSKRAVIGRPNDASARELFAGADLVVEALPPGSFDAAALARKEPGLVVLSISPFGRTGPWAERPSTEFTVQAECGSIGTRGLPGQEPFQAGGRTSEWLAGTFAAVAALAAVLRAHRSGHGERIDFAIQEVMAIAGTNYLDLLFHMLGVTPKGGLPQSVETPSIEPTRDGFVGFCTNTRQQLSDFLLMIERPDLRDDESLAQVASRVARLDEWNAIVHAWTREHSTAEVIAAAAELRIPVAPINDGDTVRQHEQLVARGVFRESPEGENGPRFTYPRPPYRIADRDAVSARPAPRLGEHSGNIEARSRRAQGGRGTPDLPLDGLRVVDLTAWWAGPSATQMLATLGADVIHVESPGRPDGMRMVGGMLRRKYEAWWECSAFFLAANTNKRGLAIDLSDDRGLAAIRKVIAGADVVIENFTPRVMDSFGLTWEEIHRLNPRAIFVRMPAFGLTGPWRNNTGFAQTMEQMTGLAWLTGHPHDQPRIQRGPCDPLAGMHAAFALLVALEERDQSGEGVHVECTMVEGALNAAAEQLIEFSAHGERMQRQGNRSPGAAPQGLYPCAGSRPGEELWLAISIETDTQWRSLVACMGQPEWAQEPGLETEVGRRAAADAIDAALRAFATERDREVLLAELLEAGVPAAALADPRQLRDSEQLASRDFFEEFEHPVVGRHPVPVVPFRYASVDHWLRSAAPTMGQHNRAVLEEAGLLTSEIDALEEAGVIGVRPEGLSV